LAEPNGTVTALLRSWREGDKEALDRLVPIVYAELRRMARARLKAERDSPLQPTALVHEAYLRLVNVESMTVHRSFDERSCRVVELRYFAGLNIDETAEALEVSTATMLPKAGRPSSVQVVWLSR
jgi:ECF sigma factor